MRWSMKAVKNELNCFLCVCVPLCEHLWKSVTFLKKQTVCTASVCLYCCHPHHLCYHCCDWGALSTLWRHWLDEGSWLSRWLGGEWFNTFLHIQNVNILHWISSCRSVLTWPDKVTTRRRLWKVGGKKACNGICSVQYKVEGVLVFKHPCVALCWHAVICCVCFVCLCLSSGQKEGVRQLGVPEAAHSIYTSSTKTHSDLGYRSKVKMT